MRAFRHGKDEQQLKLLKDAKRHSSIHANLFSIPIPLQPKRHEIMCPLQSGNMAPISSAIVSFKVGTRNHKSHFSVPKYPNQCILNTMTNTSTNTQEPET